MLKVLDHNVMKALVSDAMKTVGVIKSYKKASSMTLY